MNSTSLPSAPCLKKMMPTKSTPTGVGFLNKTSKPALAFHSFAPPTQFQLSSTVFANPNFALTRGSVADGARTNGVLAYGEFGRRPHLRFVVVVHQLQVVLSRIVDGEARIGSRVIRRN